MDKPVIKRCPNGERKDKKTGLCIKKPSEPTIQPENKPNTPNTPKTIESLSKSKSKSQKKKTIRCKAGTRRNKKTGNCEPIKPVGQPQEPVQEPIQEPVIQPQIQEQEKEQEQEPVTQPVGQTQEPVIQPQEPVIEPQTQEQEEQPLIQPVIEPQEQEQPVGQEQEQPVGEEDMDTDVLYPTIGDPDFQTKIAQRQEFAETKYDGEVKDIQKEADLMCTAKYELMPHQTFVKNFLSMQTPYNSLLLYHMLGTGKTCSAIGIAEEMRKYLQQMGMAKKIIVIASPNVQSNFKKELFDERNLKEINGIWTMDRTCIGNSLLREINPTNMKGLEKRHIIQQIDTIIHQHYSFMGYATFFNKMRKLKIITAQNTIDKSKVRKYFNHQLVIIDEVHNLRVDNTNNQDSKRVGVLLQEIAKHSENLRLLLLSATPMYNSPTEIVWLVNLLNAVDGKPAIEIRDVFDSTGDYRKADGNKYRENGRDLLVRKLTGYISFVRGENPYLFPFRVYPDVFDPQRMLGTAAFPHPSLQLNAKEIGQPMRHVPVYMNPVGDYQKKGYNHILKNIVKKMFVVKDGVLKEKNTGIFENMDSFGYTMLSLPIQALNMVYPKTIETEEFESDTLYVGKGGLDRTMTYVTEETPPRKYNFEYKEKPKANAKSTSHRFFSPTEIHKYGAKIARICDRIRHSTGIVLVYSQYIDGGIVPLALALEEMGLTRYASDESHRRNLFKKGKAIIPELDAVTMQTRKEMGMAAMNFKPAKYVMITGDKYYSADKTADIKYATSPENANGELVKVILISKAASEGVDFKNIRQIHILEPWYNMNRIEQTIGRAVRTRSHCALPFKQRNVEIYLHASHLKMDEEKEKEQKEQKEEDKEEEKDNEENKEQEKDNEEEKEEEQENKEAVDLYLYRFAEKKAVQIGNITRLLKQTAVDCVLNISQTNFTAEQLMQVAENESVEQHLSSRNESNRSQIVIPKFPVGDRPYTDICDYMETCELKCEANITSAPIIQETYTESFLKTNSLVIMQKIRDLFKDKFVFTREELIRSINLTKKYPIDHIYYALSQLVGNRTEEIVDHYGRIGYVVNRGTIYAFQPVEIFDENATVYDRMVPVDKKFPAMKFELSRDIIPASMFSITNSIESNASSHTSADKSKSSSLEPSNRVISSNPLLDTLAQSMKWVLQEGLQIPPGDLNWYKHLNRVYNVLALSQIYAVEPVSILKYAVFHFMDTTKLEDKLSLLSILYGTRPLSTPLGAILVENLRAYFQQRMIRLDDNENRDKMYVVLASASGDKNVLYSKDESQNKWSEVTSYTELTRVQPHIKSLLDSGENINAKIGFMYTFKEQGVVFKIKDRMQVDKKNNQGAVCLSAKKELVIQRINELLERAVYKNDKTFEKVDYCVILEMLLRHKTATSGQIYFFSQEMAIHNKITQR